jgi:hypothetical protein
VVFSHTGPIIRAKRNRWQSLSVRERGGRIGLKNQVVAEYWADQRQGHVVRRTGNKQRKEEKKGKTKKFESHDTGLTTKTVAAKLAATVY